MGVILTPKESDVCKLLAGNPDSIERKWSKGLVNVSLAVASHATFFTLSFIVLHMASAIPIQSWIACDQRTRSQEPTGSKQMGTAFNTRFGPKSNVGFNRVSGRTAAHSGPDRRRYRGRIQYPRATGDGLL